MHHIGWEIGEVRGGKGGEGKRKGRAGQGKEKGETDRKRKGGGRRGRVSRIVIPQPWPLCYF